MLHLRDVRDGLHIFKALGSEIRLKILALLSEQEQLNMNDIAEHLNLTNGALTSHIKKLQDCNLIEVTTASGKKGIQKICRISQDTLVADLKKNETSSSMYEVELDPGLYFDYNVTPTCGIATKDHIIGVLDDPRFFSHPDRINSGIIWLTLGFLEYKIPNFLKPKQQIQEIKISFELSSEAPGVNDNWPSDIHFWLNGTLLGYWTSPGDFSDARGLLTPSWWDRGLNQHGLLKRLTIGETGTFIDGMQISDITLKDLNLDYKSDMCLRIGVPDDATNKGGMTLYGKGFGNYNQGIRIQVNWKHQTSL